MWATVCREFFFDAAHYLPDYPGVCSRMHGHRWTLEVGIEGPIQANGMVLDFAELDSKINPIVEVFDHTTLNDFLKMPTAENLCIHFLKEIEKSKLTGPEDTSDLRIAYLKLWETPRSHVILMPDEPAEI